MPGSGPELAFAAGRSAVAYCRASARRKVAVGRWGICGQGLGGLRLLVRPQALKSSPPKRAKRVVSRCRHHAARHAARVILANLPSEAKLVRPLAYVIPPWRATGRYAIPVRPAAKIPDQRHESLRKRDVCHCCALNACPRTARGSDPACGRRAWTSSCAWPDISLPVPACLKKGFWSDQFASVLRPRPSCRRPTDRDPSPQILLRNVGVYPT